MSNEIDPPYTPPTPPVPTYPDLAYASSPFPYSVTVPGVGLCEVLDPQGVPGYRVRLPNGEVQTFAASGEASQENASTDIANQPEPTPDPALAWNAFLSGSIIDGPTGIALKANRQARNDFIGQATLMREALDGGALTGSSNVSIWDSSNVEHVMTVTACRGLLLRYGIAWNTAFNELAP